MVAENCKQSKAMEQIERIYNAQADAYEGRNIKFMSLISTYFKSTYEMAQILSVSWPTARRWEKYPAMMTIGDIKKIADHCQMDIKEMASFIYECQYVSPSNETEL
jgi:hypothetical protein